MAFVIALPLSRESLEKTFFQPAKFQYQGRAEISSCLNWCGEAKTFYRFSSSRWLGFVIAYFHYKFPIAQICVISETRARNFSSQKLEGSSGFCFVKRLERLFPTGHVSVCFRSYALRGLLMQVLFLLCKIEMKSKFLTVFLKFENFVENLELF